jgi:hypothetical protein
VLARFESGWYVRARSRIDFVCKRQRIALALEPTAARAASNRLRLSLFPVRAPQSPVGLNPCFKSSRSVRHRRLAACATFAPPLSPDQRKSSELARNKRPRCENSIPVSSTTHTQASISAHLSIRDPLLSDSRPTCQLALSSTPPNELLKNPLASIFLSCMTPSPAHPFTMCSHLKCHLHLQCDPFNFKRPVFESRFVKNVTQHQFSD